MKLISHDNPKTPQSSCPKKLPSKNQSRYEKNILPKAIEMIQLYLYTQIMLHHSTRYSCRFIMKFVVKTSKRSYRQFIERSFSCVPISNQVRFDSATIDPNSSLAVTYAREAHLFPSQ